MSASGGEDPVRWLLDTIKSEWPRAEWPDTLRRVHRGDPEILETGERKRVGELTVANYVGAALGDTVEESMGISYNFRIETPIRVRIEGVHVHEKGKIESDDAFQNLVDDVKEAVKRVRKHPPIDGGAREYHTITIEGEENNVEENRDYFRADFVARIHGYEIRND